MTRWFVWFQFKDLPPTFRVVIAEGLEVAEMMANDLAHRDKVRFIGAIVASEQFNPLEINPTGQSP